MNLNKLFPRLTISAKLAIAFVLLAALPALAVTLVSALSVASERRVQAESLVRYDLDRAELRLSRALEEARQTVELLRAGFVEPWIKGERDWDREQIAGVAALGLASHRSAVFRVKVFNTDGDPMLELERDGRVRLGDELEPTGGLFYLLAAEGLAESDAVYLPVELRDLEGPESGAGVMAAVAILQAIRAADGELLAVLVGEAEAAPLFAQLEDFSPGLQGATALVRTDGLYLFHSEHKRDWNSLLATQGGVLLTAELGEALAREVASGAAGSARSEQLFVEFRPVNVGTAPGAPLILYRSLPNAVIVAPVRAFLMRVAAAGVLLLSAVLLLAIVAARTLTRPIYRLQRAARELADGGTPEPLEFETNDELEDLADDFTLMASRLTESRNALEAKVVQRTRALEMTRAELSEVITHSADAIIGLDPGGKVRLWNNGARDLFGYDAAEAIGHDVEGLIGLGGRATSGEARLIRHDLQSAGAIVNLRTHRRTRDRELIPVTLTQTIIEDGDGTSLGSSLIIRDDRMHAKLEEHMRRSERLAAVSIMAAGLAHEINNPLSVLGNRIELMQREAARNDVGPRLGRDIQVVGEKVARIRTITNDLLSFAREGQSDPTDVCVGDVIHRLERLFRRTLLAQGVEVKIDLQPSLPTIRANQTAIETVFANLILNAQQAMPDGGTIAIRALTEEGPARLVVTVEDDGPGIPVELRSRVFEPFFTTKGDRGGTGLGLAVCRALLERHGGHIAIGNHQEVGSSFTVHLPLPTSEHE